MSALGAIRSRGKAKREPNAPTRWTTLSICDDSVAARVRVPFRGAARTGFIRSHKVRGVTSVSRNAGRAQQVAVPVH